MDHVTFMPTGEGGYREAKKGTKEPSHLQIIHTIWKHREYSGEGRVLAPERLPAPQWTVTKSATYGGLFGHHVYPVGCVGVYPTQDEAIAAAKSFNKTLVHPAVLLIYDTLYQPPASMRERVFGTGRRLAGKTRVPKARLSR